jgi:hypothetical protein
MPNISISYRRDDTGPVTGRLSDRLIDRYGARSIFVDIDNIPAGVDFRHHIHTVLLETNVLLAMVGTRWLGPRASGETRIREDDDPVRVEIATALRNETFVIPVLVDGAMMPKESDLPEEIKPFAYRNAVPLSSGKDFNVHVQRLIAAIDRALAVETVVPSAAPLLGTGGAPASATSGRPGEIPTAAPKLAAWLSLLTIYLICPIVLLALGHYLMIMKFNLDPFYVRAASIVVPAAFGFAFFAREGGGPAAAFLFGAGGAAVVVVGMMATVGLVDGRPILPASAFEWQETIEYFVGITLAALGGTLVARLAVSFRGKG